MSHLLLLRPQQWVKNLFVFAGLAFGAKLTDANAVAAALLGFALLCLVSSTVYIVNDIHDRAEDRLHPRKCKRPLASGAVTVSTAWAMAAGLLLVGLGGSYLLDRGFALVVLAYLLLQVAYTFALKQMVLLDVIAIGLGFVLRAVAGGVLVHVPISHWLVLCTFTLCLFMGFSKRRCELSAMAENRNHDAGKHRKTLREYTPDLLNHMTTLTAGVAVVSFMLYSTDQKTIDKFGTNYLLYTLPMVVYAIFRFTVLVEHGRADGPTDVVLKDRPFQAALLAWAATAMLIVYRGRELEQWLAALPR